MHRINARNCNVGQRFLKMRKLLDGTEVQELPEPKTLTVYTKCPEKYRLVDMETGEIYIGRDTDGRQHWKKLDES